LTKPCAFDAFGFRRDLHRWRQLVSPAWLTALLAGEAGPAMPENRWRLLEVGSDERDAFLRGHIPGAGYLDTNTLEQGPLWNKVEDTTLRRRLLELGIRHDTTVILYGRNMLAAARAAHLMLYAGITDVRLLDGGLAGWTNHGEPLVPGWPARMAPATGFGIAVPARPEFFTDMHGVRQLLCLPDASLVSVRTWNEFTGRTSGYGYIPAKGEIPGAIWGRCGNDDDVNSMSEFHDAQGRMLCASAIESIWQARGMRREQRTVFYCGTGWRASLAFFYAWLLGWTRISVYDGGWLEWSAIPDNPVQLADDTGNDTDRVRRQAAERTIAV
jgi:3-mercaptopyruvate sulfurtransferase SseA